MKWWEPVLLIAILLLWVLQWVPFEWWLFKWLHNKTRGDEKV